MQGKLTDGERGKKHGETLTAESDVQHIVEWCGDVSMRRLRPPDNNHFEYKLMIQLGENSGRLNYVTSAGG